MFLLKKLVLKINNIHLLNLNNWLIKNQNLVEQKIQKRGRKPTVRKLILNRTTASGKYGGYVKSTILEDNVKLRKITNFEINELIEKFARKAKTRKHNKNTIEWEKIAKSLNNCKLPKNIYSCFEKGLAKHDVKIIVNENDRLYPRKVGLLNEIPLG